MATTDSSAPPAHRTTTKDVAAGDPFAHAGDDDLYRAACSAMRLLQDRQAHTPEEMLDPRERKVLRQLRSAVRLVVEEDLS